MGAAGVVSLDASLPAVRLGKHSVTRLILGSNPFSGGPSAFPNSSNRRRFGVQIRREKPLRNGCARATFFAPAIQRRRSAPMPVELLRLASPAAPRAGSLPLAAVPRPALFGSERPFPEMFNWRGVERWASSGNFSNEGLGPTSEAEPDYPRNTPQYRSKSLNSRMVGHSECAGINRHVVGDERALQERRTLTRDSHNMVCLIVNR